MKRVFVFGMIFILSFGLFGCGKEETVLERLKSFTEQEDYIFAYLDNDDPFVIDYDDNFDGNCSIHFMNEDGEWDISYIPKHETFVFEMNFEDEEIPLMYDVKNDEYNFYVDEEDYMKYMFCEIETYDECIDKYSEKMKVDKDVEKNLKKYLNDCKEILKKHDLVINDIDVPYDELSK